MKLFSHSAYINPSFDGPVLFDSHEVEVTPTAKELETLYTYGVIAVIANGSVSFMTLTRNSGLSYMSGLQDAYIFIRDRMWASPVSQTLSREN